MACGVHVDCSEVVIRLLAIGLSNGAVIALNAIGVTLVYGIVRVVNFAYGDLFALTTVLVASLVAGLGLARSLPLPLLLGGLALTLGAAVAGATLLNVAIERAAFRPFRSGSRIAPLIGTIGISFILYQVALLSRYVTNRYIPGEHRSVPGIPEVPRIRIPELLPTADIVRALGLPLNVAYSLKDVLVPLLAALLALLVGWLLQSTRVGRALRACAQDAEMAQLCGVDRDGAIRLAFAIGGALAGAAAFIFALYYTHPFTLYGAQSGLIAFTAAVLGGIGKPRGAFLSGLLLGVLAAFSDYFLAAQWTSVLILAILVLLLVLRPTGLAGEAEGQDWSTTAVLTAGAARAPGRQLWLRRWLPGGLFVLALLYPLLDAAVGWHLQLVMSGMLIFALLALGLNLVLGLAGLLDLGYAACFGIGAYTAGLLTMPGGRLAGLFPGPDDFLIVLAVSAAAAGLFGVLSGSLTQRLHSEYLAIVTLALGQIVPQLVLNLNQLTGGARGMSALPPPRFFTYTLGTPVERYYLALLLVLLVASASRRVAYSRIGRAWAALSVDELAAVSCGVAPTRNKCLAFVLGAAIAGIAGALFASIFSYVDPTQTELRVSVMVLAMVVIGGTGSILGSIIGAFVVAGYDQLAIPLLGAWLQEPGEIPGGWIARVFDVRSLNFLSFGLILYLTVLLRARRR